MARLKPANAQDLWDELITRPTVPLEVSGVLANAPLVSGPGILVGWALRDTDAANPLSIQLLDGTSTGGSLVAGIECPVNNGSVGGPAVDGVFFRRGLFLVRSSGTADGAIWVKI